MSFDDRDVGAWARGVRAVRTLTHALAIDALRTAPLSYTVGVLAPVVTMLLVRAVRPALDLFPSAQLIAVVLAVAWYCGFRAALLSTAISAVLLRYYVTPADAFFRTSVTDVVGLAVFCTVGVLTSFAAVRLSQTVRDLERERQRERVARSEAERHSHEAQELRHISRILTQTTSPMAAGQRVADAVKRLFNPTSVVVRLFEPDGSLVAIAVAGENEVVRPGHLLPPGAGAVGLCAAERRMIITESILTDPRIYLPPNVREQHARLRHQLVIATPLTVDGVVIGTLALNETQARTFSQAELALLQALANHAAVGIRYVQLFVQERSAREEAEAANRAKDQFLAMLGHELRNPLAAISSGIGVLNRIGDHHEVAATARAVITRQVGHLAKLMDDLLDVARVTTGKIVLSRSTVDVADLTRRCLAVLESTEVSRGHHVTVAAESVWVEADETRLTQVLENLLTNAFKYTPPGGSIDVTVTRQRSDAVIRVADSGVGISPALLPRVFDLFVQGDGSLDRRKGGLGIGLTLVKRLMEMHGGSVEAASDGPGKGSTFTVRLPHVAAPMTGSWRETSMGSTAGGNHVLIVEDNVDARQMLRAMLQLDGHEVTEAEDGITGLEQALAVRPDIAVIDIGLPGMDGCEVARRLRATETGAKMVLVAVSGYGQPDDQRRSLEAGFDQHLVKPVDPKMLADAIAGAAKRRRSPVAGSVPVGGSRAYR